MSSLLISNFFFFKQKTAYEMRISDWSSDGCSSDLFAMLSMWNAGLRVVDVRDPASPREVAYFNPGRFVVADPSGGSPIGAALALASPTQLDQAWAHSRSVAETGHIWLTTRSGGYGVPHVQTQVRARPAPPGNPPLHHP